MTVTVIGAGLAGLSAAIEAARAGADVVVLDARDRAGGRARTRTVDGFLLNEGAHALYIDGPANAFLRELGCEPPGGVPAAGRGVAIKADGAGAFPSGPVSLLRTPVLKGDRSRLLRLFARLGRIDPGRFARKTTAETVAELLGTGPAAQFGLALLRLSTYGNDADVSSGDAGILQLKLAAGAGVRYLDGGWQTIIDSLRAEAEALGVEVCTGAKVASVRAATDGITIGSDGETRPTDAVVLAVGGPRNVSGILGDGSPTATRWAASARPATVASLDVGLACDWGDAPPFALGIDQPLYLSVHAPVARLAPDGHTLVHVMRYQMPGEDDDPERDRGQCETLLDRINPGWRDRVRHQQFNRRLVAAFDQPRATDGGLAGRPGIDTSGLDGVFVAGDWVGPVGVLADASVASGRAAGLAAARVAARRVRR